RLLLAVPVTYSATGTVEGVLILELSLPELLTQRANYFGDRLERIELLRGQVVLASMRGPIQEETVASESPLHLEGPLAELKLTVRLRESQTLMLAPLSRLAEAYAGLGALMLILALGIARVISQRLTHPLSLLSRRANEIAGGNRLDVVLPEIGHDEVGRLTGALNQMLLSLRASQDTLEQQVADRTSELAHTRTRLQAVLDNVLEAIISIDEYGTIELFSHGAEQLFGYRPEDVMGHNVSILMPEPFRSQHDRYLQQYMVTGRAKIIGAGREVECLRRDGSIFPGELSVTETAIEGRRVFVGMIRDITERRRIDKMKNEFISTVSHELRTPLTSIHGALGLMAGGVTGALPGTTLQLVSVAHRNSERLLVLVNDILDMERIATGKMQYDMALRRVSAMMEQSVEANRGYALKYNVSYVLAERLPGATIRVDDTRCTQVLSNLLSNAAKFSPPGGQVIISASRRDGAVRIQVSDSGPGIPAHFHDKLFQKFSQADSTDSRQKGGTGLGLSISLALTEAMGGRIGYEPNVPCGSIFYIEFPEIHESGKRAV
ncbi:MAG: PAS domain S-box protein, partial [Gammaproteobacteria bacterium]|nr:PAS domain S-box protein [Gammaproteobacteria bacterium]